MTARETELKAIRARVVASLGGWAEINRPVGPVDSVRPHICGLSGVGILCPACATVREQDGE